MSNRYIVVEFWPFPYIMTGPDGETEFFTSAEDAAIFMLEECHIAVIIPVP